MTRSAAQQQNETIKKITTEAIKSKESARKILIDAGIVKEKKNNRASQKKSK